MMITCLTTTLTELLENPRRFLDPDLLGWHGYARILIERDPLGGHILIQKIESHCSRCGTGESEMFLTEGSVLCLACVNENSDKLLRIIREKSEGE